MDRLKEFLDWHCENPHNVNFKMIVGKEDREETLKAMYEISELLYTGLTPEQIMELKERDTEKEQQSLGFWSEVYGRLYLSELRKTFYWNWNCRVLLSLWTAIEVGGMTMAKILYTNNSRKIAGVPLLRKKDKRKRVYTRNRADEDIQAILDWWNGRWED